MGKRSTAIPVTVSNPAALPAGVRCRCWRNGAGLPDGWACRMCVARRPSVGSRDVGRIVEPDGTAGTAFRRQGEAHHLRSEEHTSELQSLMRISYAVFCLKKK